MKTRRKSEKPWRPRSDPAFAWAASNPALAPWREPLAEWARQHTNRKTAVWFGNHWLDDVATHPADASTPETCCRRSTSGALPFLARVAARQNDVVRSRLQNTARAFFDWYLAAHLSAPDDAGRPVVSPDHANPVQPARTPPASSESHRSAMPTRFLRELLKLLTENDWAWARAQAADTVDVVDPSTGLPERLWCPVRASVLAIKLLLPLRTFQVRVMESSEGDDICYRGGEWVANVGPGAPKTSQRRRRGFLCRIEDASTGENGCGFYVNTNKTADAAARANERGYLIPWENRQVIDIVEQLEVWQTTHNPMAEPTAWSSLHDDTVCRSAPRSGRAFFLMRDPNGMFPNEPITDDRVRGLWNGLVAELERRLAANGETMANGEPIRLTRPRSAERSERVSRYDLHTLRVSLITALAVDGGLPLHILSKCVAGHASVVMTIYYCKVGREAMNEALDAATARIDTVAQERFAQYLKSGDRDDAALVINDPSALAAADRGDTAAWLMLDTGICPVGATRCHDGGPLVAKRVHGPVPGGARNCARCRFHITGPAFLGGLVAKFNTKSLERDSARREYEPARTGLRQLEDERVEVETKGGSFDQGAIERARDRLDRAEVRLASVCETMQALYVLVLRCRDAMSKNAGGLNLLAVGSETDLRVAIRATSDIDLADRVCQVADIYPSLETADASMRRARAIDRMAMRHGRAPVMLPLSEEEALRAGNEMLRLMERQFGRERSIEIVAGDGIEEGAARVLDDWKSSRLSIAPPPSGMPALEHQK